MSQAFRCPTCKQEFSERTSTFPFCTDRCKLLDLGAWAKEQYRIKGRPVNPDELNPELADQEEEGSK